MKNTKADCVFGKERSPCGAIVYYAYLRICEVCGLTWQDINLEEQYLTVKRSVRYDDAKHKTIIGPTKRKKIRTVDFRDTLTTILKKARN